MELISQVLNSSSIKERSSSNILNPEEIRSNRFIKLEDEGANEEELVEGLKWCIHHSVNVYHPLYANQLFSSPNDYALYGSIIADIINITMATYEMSSIFTIMENEWLKHLSKISGYRNVCGTFSPGGSLSGLYAMLCARHHFNEKIRKEGLSSKRKMIIFASEDAHYSVDRNALICGLGLESVIKISLDEDGSMNCSELEEKILNLKNQEVSKSPDSGEPFMIWATLGTTIFGSLDKISEISKIASQHKIWLHIDASFGGGLLFSRSRDRSVIRSSIVTNQAKNQDQEKDLLEGLETSDSLTINYHKIFDIPQQCSSILFNNRPTIMKEALGLNSSYLFQNDKPYASYDKGDESIQCARKNDILKLWLYVKKYGIEHLGKQVEKRISLAQELRRKLISSPTKRFRLVQPEYQKNLTSVCFIYLPPVIDQFKDETCLLIRMLHQVPPLLKKIMIQERKMMINFQTHPKVGINFFRITVTKVEDQSQEFIDHLQYLAETFLEEEIFRLTEESQRCLFRPERRCRCREIKHNLFLEKRIY